MKRIFTAGLLATVASTVFAGGVIDQLYNTGVDNNKELLDDGKTEPHWTLVSAPDNNTYTLQTIAPHSAWAPEETGAVSGWINPTGYAYSSLDTGKWTYELKINLTGIQLDTVKIAGKWLSDNGAKILLNGNETVFSNQSSQTSAPFTQWTEFILKTGFVAGVNSLRFEVANGAGWYGGGANPTGLRVQFDSVNSASVPVPEPFTIGLAIAGVALAARKRRK